MFSRMFVKSHELVRYCCFLGADSVSGKLLMSLFLGAVCQGQGLEVVVWPGVGV